MAKLTRTPWPWLLPIALIFGEVMEGGAQQLLEGIRAGGDWLWLSKGLFDGGGSYGNGAAMRVAPLGAYFAADLDLVVQQADASAVVTHSHPEGRAGAIAVALAAAMARRLAGQSGDRAGLLFDEVLRASPRKPNPVWHRSGQCEMAAEVHPGKVAELVGSGQQVSAQDTVPFVIWCAAHHLDDYEEAFWATLSGLGDFGGGGGGYDLCDGWRHCGCPWKPGATGLG